jgi:uncharacterized membrane protein YgdD (TMEM256/DUF423 family)
MEDMNIAFWTRLGAVMMLISVGAGAFGAHGLKARVSAEMLAVFETGARYQAYHALGILAAAWAGSQFGGKLPAYAAVCFTAGIVLFSGSLYALCLTGMRKLGMITPIGGVLFMVGWALLALAPARS